MSKVYETSYYEISYPGIIIDIQLRRKLNYHLVQTYAPSVVYLIGKCKHLSRNFFTLVNLKNS